jgi:uncharacterized protein (TIGR00369 family)
VSDRSRTITWEDPSLLVEIARGKSGLEALRAIMDGTAANPPIGQLLAFRLVAAEDGLAAFEAEPAEFHYNPIGVVHGGFAMTLLDSALGCAVLSTLPAGVTYTTTDTQVRFIRPITTATGTVRCEGRIIHVGRTTGIAEGRLTSAAGKVLATGTSACAILR